MVDGAAGASLFACSFTVESLETELEVDEFEEELEEVDEDEELA